MTNFTYRPEVPITQTLQWRTDVIKSYDGTENRMSLLGSPRQRLSYAHLLYDDEVRQLRADLFNSLQSPGKIPLWHEPFVITADVSIGAASISGSFIGCDISPDEYVYLDREDGTVGEFIQISTISSTLIALSGVTVGAYPSGSYVYPVLSGYISEGQGFARAPVELSEFQLEFLAVDPKPLGGSGATLETHNGLPLLNRRPLANAAVEESFRKRIDRIDFGGAVNQVTGMSVSDIHSARRYLINSRSELQYFKLFLDTIVGMREPFYCATWREDLVLSVQPTPGASTIRVVDDPDYLVEWNSLAHDNLQLETTDGVIQRRVSGTVDNGDGTLTITFYDALPAGSYTTSVVSFLEHCRLGTDTVTIVHSGLHSVVDLSVAAISPGVTPFYPANIHEARSWGFADPAEIFLPHYVGPSTTGRLPAPVHWVLQTGSTATVDDDTGTIVRTAGTPGYNLSARSEQMCAGDCSIKFKLSVDADNTFCGLNTAYTGVAYADLEFAIYVASTDNLVIYEDGAIAYNPAGTYNGTDDLEIRRVGGEVTYWEGGVKIWTSAKTTTDPLMAIALPRDIGSAVFNCEFSGSLYTDLLVGEIQRIVLQEGNTPTPETALDGDYNGIHFDGSSSDSFYAEAITELDMNAISWAVLTVFGGDLYTNMWYNILGKWFGGVGGFELQCKWLVDGIRVVMTGASGSDTLSVPVADLRDGLPHYALFGQDVNTDMGYLYSDLGSDSTVGQVTTTGSLTNQGLFRLGRSTVTLSNDVTVGATDIFENAQAESMLLTGAEVAAWWATR